MKAEGVGKNASASPPADGPAQEKAGSGERFAAVLERGQDRREHEAREQKRGSAESAAKSKEKPTQERPRGEEAQTSRSSAHKGAREDSPDPLAPFHVPAPVLQRPPAIARPAGPPSQMVEVAQAIADKILDGVRIEANPSGRIDFVMELRPEVLGGMQIRVHVEAGQVHAVFSAVQPEVRAVLESQGQGLRQALRDRGLDLAELHIAEERETAEQRDRGSGREDPGHGRRGGR